METHDRRIIYARQILTEARKRDVAVLSPNALIREVTEFCRVLGWALDVVDDFADTQLDEDVTQITFSGGVYVAPADVLALCGPCLNRLLPDEISGTFKITRAAV
jgi:hypothetical protein